MDKIQEIKDLIKSWELLINKWEFENSLNFLARAFDYSVNLFENDKLNLDNNIAVAISSFKAWLCFEKRWLLKDAFEHYELSVGVFDNIFILYGENPEIDEKYLWVYDQFIYNLISLWNVLKKLEKYDSYGYFEWTPVFEIALSKLNYLITISSQNQKYLDMKNLILNSINN